MILATTSEKDDIRKNIDRLVKRDRPKKRIEKVIKITNLDKILHRSIVTKSTNKYFTTGHHVDKPWDLLSEGSPYTDTFKPNVKSIDKIYRAPTENWKIREAIPERLRVETPPTARGILDTIPDYLKVVSGRPVHQHFNRRSFTEQMRVRFLQNLQSGFYCDIIKRIDEHDNIARTILQKAVDDSEEAVWSLRVFLSGQIKDIRSIEDELKTVVNLKTKKELAMDIALRKMGNLKVDIFKIMEKINETIRCRDFLHSLSSDQWIYEYNITKDIYIRKKKDKVDELMNNFEKYKIYLGDKDPGLEEIMLKFIKLFEKSGPARIPFKTSNDLALALKKLEKSNKDSLIHIKELEEPVKKVRDYLKEVDKSYEAQLDFVKEEIDRTEKELMEVRAKNDMMRVMMHDMNKKYKKVLVSSEVLEEKGLIKALYDEIVVKQRLNPTQLEMWEDIEEAFMELKQKMAFIPKKEALRRKKIIKEKLKTDDIASVKARNRITQVEQMIQSLHRAYDKPRKFVGKVMTPRSQPPPPPERTPTPETPPRIFEYEKVLKIEHSTFTPLSKRYPSMVFTPVPDSSPQLSQGSSEDEIVRKVTADKLRRQSIVPKPKSSQLPITEDQRLKFQLEPDDDIDYKNLFGDRLEIVDAYDPECSLIDPPKVVLPKYVPKVAAAKKNSEDEESDY